MNTGTLPTLLILILVILSGISCSDNSHDDHGHGDGHHDDHEEVSKGPNNGRLLDEGEFSIEIVIFESGVAPEFHVYAYDAMQPIDINQLELDIQLQRTGNVTDQISFSPQHDYLRGDMTIYEPHSFDVIVNARYKGKSYQWQYESHEGRTIMPAETAHQAGIITETIGPATIIESRTLTGMVKINPDRFSRVRARFPGVVSSVNIKPGDQVKKGQRLATVQSNESLQNYTIKAPMGGVLVKRDIQPGEATTDRPLFVIADLTDVWIEFNVFESDLPAIKPGKEVVVESMHGDELGRSVIDWVSPLISQSSQSALARITVDNKDSQLRPGQYVRGNVAIAEYDVPLAVRQSAIQRFRDFQVVFARFDDTYEVRMLELGRSNNEWVEVLGGIDAGTQYVTTNSYLIKADIEKSGASHDH